MIITGTAQISLLIPPADGGTEFKCREEGACEKELGSCEATPLSRLPCARHRFHYLPFPTSNVMTGLFLLPKASNFHFDNIFLTDPVVIMDGSTISPFSPQECPARSRAEALASPQAGSLRPALGSAVGWHISGRSEIGVVFKRRKGTAPQVVTWSLSLWENVSRNPLLRGTGQRGKETCP